MMNRVLFAVYPLLAAIAITGCSKPGNDDAAGTDDNRYFRFAVISDTHFIDDYYTGPATEVDGGGSIYETADKFTVARDAIKALRPQVEFVFIAGDFIHSSPVETEDWDFLMNNRTRYDIAAELIAGFEIPVHIALGNNDYAVPDISREFTHRVLKEKFDLDPYYSFQYGEFLFIVLNDSLGLTQDLDSPEYSKNIGSLGSGQLDWLETEMQRGLPTFIVMHYPLLVMDNDEGDGRSILSVLSDNADRVRILIAGHFHLWLDYSSAFDVSHIAVGAIREDENAYMIFEADNETTEYQILNYDCVNWNGPDATPCLE